MKTLPQIHLADVQAVYSGPEGRLWELLMGEQIHIGGLQSSQDLAERAEIGDGQQGVDLCCANGAGMRFLVRFRKVARMKGVDATRAMLELGRRRCAEEGLADRISFLEANVCTTGLPGGHFDFVWGEDAWCYVEDKPKLIAEAARLIKPEGTIAFTDWMEGPAGLSDEEAKRYLGFMKFPNVLALEEYRTLLQKQGCAVEVATDTGRFANHVPLYLDLLEKQLTYDALKIIGFDSALARDLVTEMRFLHALAKAGKIMQGLIIARKTETLMF
ncbi:MAG TPA: methyltransferase domain-containing protein [Candidatus Sulfotelmatobacter sp.]|nr:methyltransferase domain-containing protein [Candidatus Sulfotelmatobacter sp.]